MLNINFASRLSSFTTNNSLRHDADSKSRQTAHEEGEEAAPTMALVVRRSLSVSYAENCKSVIFFFPPFCAFFFSKVVFFTNINMTCSSISTGARINVEVAMVPATITSLGRELHLCFKSLRVSLPRGKVERQTRHTAINTD